MNNDVKEFARGYIISWCKVMTGCLTVGFGWAVNHGFNSRDYHTIINNAKEKAIGLLEKSAKSVITEYGFNEGDFNLDAEMILPKLQEQYDWRLEDDTGIWNSEMHSNMKLCLNTINGMTVVAELAEFKSAFVTAIRDTFNCDFLRALHDGVYVEACKPIQEII